MMHGQINGTATVSIHHTPYSVWLLGKLMLQLLLIDPQLSEKHWLIESWYINDDQRTCGPLDTVETCFGSISNVRDFDVCFQCPWDFFLQCPSHCPSECTDRHRLAYYDRLRYSIHHHL